MAKFSEVLTTETARIAAENGITDLKEFFTNVEVMKKLMDGRAKHNMPRISMSEALRAADASILFPKVISDVLLRPKEPLMIGQTLLSRTINVDNVRSVEFPTMGAIRAFDIGDTGEYREQLPAFTEHITEIKVNKSGLKIGISEDVIADSMWDLLALYVEAAGYAMLRHKEEKIFLEFQAKGHKVFDNSSTNSAAWTHGKTIGQAANYSVTYDDFIDAMGALVANEYVPTDIIMHPLAWAVFAKDPILRNVMYTQGQVGQSIWTTKPDFDQTANVPWQVAYQVTPFVPFTMAGTLSTGPASGLAACNYTDIYVVDRNNSVVILQKDPMSTDEFEDPNRDIKMMKVKERYGVGSINGGRASAVIANVRLEQNWSPQLVVGTVTPS
jgi:HK97 family phage major capsid protein